MKHVKHLFIVTYDVSDSKRLRKVYQTMRGYGRWLQFSVFECKLSKKGLIYLRIALEAIIVKGEDQVLFLDLGSAKSVKPKIHILGRPYIHAPEDKPMVV